MKPLCETVKPLQIPGGAIIFISTATPCERRSKDNLEVPVSNADESSWVVGRYWYLRRHGKGYLNYSLVVWPRICPVLLPSMYGWVYRRFQAEVSL